MSGAFLTPERFGNSVIFTIPNLLAESSDIIEASDYPDKTIYVYGTGTVTIKGSPDGIHWGPGMKDQSGTTISLVVAASVLGAFILENPRYIQITNNNAAGVFVSLVCSR